jgi:teichuronic acid biosynthesis glycosyltransferase TuaC
MDHYTVGLFANMYPESPSDWRGIFIRRMVEKLESRGVIVKKAVKTNPHVWGYGPFYANSIRVALSPSIDILQAHYIPHSSIIPSLFKLNRPLVLKFHGDDGRIYPFENVFNRSLTRFMLGRADHVITVSNEIRDRLMDLGGDPENITTISSGVNTGLFKPRSPEEARKKFNFPIEKEIFLFLGRIHPWKGVSELIDAARDHPDALFIIAGPGKVLPHPPNCRFIGEVPAESVPDLINSADVSVLPSYTEGISNFVMESLSCEIPIIATAVGGNPEIVHNYETGLLIPPKDRDALSQALTWMEENHGRRKDMGKKGRVEMITSYDEDLLINRLMNIHRDLL